MTNQVLQRAQYKALIHASIFPGKNQYISPFSNFSWSEGGSNSQSMGRQSSVLPLSQIPSLTVPQLPIMIIYNSTWSKTQKKDPFTSLHKIKANLPHLAEFEILRNGALVQPSINENTRGQLFFTLSNVTVSLARGCHRKGNSYKRPLSA